MSDETPKLSIKRIDDVVVVHLALRKILDGTMVEQIARQLYALVAEADVPKMVIDFGDVSHMTSSALGMLTTLLKRIREKNGELRLCNISETIFEVFKITRLNEVLKVCDSVEAAVGDVSQ